VTLTRVSGGHGGSWSGQLANGTSSTGTCSLNDSPNWVAKTLAGRYNGSVWVRGATSGASIKAKFTEYTGTTANGSATTTATLTTSWQKLSLDYTPVAPGSTLDFNTYISSAPPGTCFFADDLAIYQP
jgi:hypothetical protein